MFLRKTRLMVFKIDIEYDEEAKVFVAISDDIKGLALEAETPEQLRQYLAEVVPVLLSRNHGITLSEGADKHALDLNIKSIVPWLASGGTQGALATG
jgi:hypothetical protein